MFVKGPNRHHTSLAADEGRGATVTTPEDDRLEGDLDGKRQLLQRAYFSSFWSKDGDTTATKANRLRILDQEMVLLSRLADGDTETLVTRAQAHLSELWFSERGQKALSELSFVESAYTSSDDGAALEIGAVELGKLIRTYEGWTEPINRLAYIRFKQGNYAEAVEFCEEVLAMKPWHYGARSGLAASLKQLNKFPEARIQASLLLPPPGTSISSDGKPYSAREMWLSSMLREVDRAKERALSL
jgi:hypothetical protein